MRNWTKEKNHWKGILVVIVLLLLADGCVLYPGRGNPAGFFEAAESAAKESEVSASEDTGLADPGAAAKEAAADESTGGPAVPDLGKPAGAYEQGSVLYVHVCGAVKAPGLYRVAAGARIGDAVESAGGFTKTADVNAVNLASLLEDGQQIYVPDQSETKSPQDRVSLAGAAQKAEAGQDASDKVNINTAGAEILTSLKGIGESKAAAIIAYRQEHGAFSSPEDIRNVPGIGEGIYNKIKDSITV